jgi:hypothetical protein
MVVPKSVCLIEQGQTDGNSRVRLLGVRREEVLHVTT